MSLRRLVVLCILSFAPAMLVACAGRAVARPAATASHVAGDAAGIYFGFSPRDWPVGTGEIDRFERDAEKHVAIVDIYEDWEDDDPPADVLSTIHDHGSTPMITWQPKNYGASGKADFPLAKIAAGNYDDRIARFADDLAALGYPIFLRFAHEMNGDGYPWNVGTHGQTAADFVAAWRHVHDVFAAEGATNVLWVWNPLYESSRGTDFASIFPGDGYVDWVGLDGYNGGTLAGDWRSFSAIFAAPYQMVTALSAKPVMIGETASDEAGDDGTMKAAWIREMFEHALPAMPRIQAVLWYNVDEPPHDWEIESSVPAQIAFAADLASPRYLSSFP